MWLEMLRSSVLSVVILSSFCCLVWSKQTYTNRWDNIDIDQILKNDRILKRYVDCLMDRGKCTPDGQELKNVLPEAMQSECEKCTEAQKIMAGKALSYILQYKRDYWLELLGKYDPKGEFRKKHEYEDSD